MTDHPKPWNHNHDDGWVYDANGVRFLNAKMHHAVGDFANLMRDRMSWGDEQGKMGWDSESSRFLGHLVTNLADDTPESMVDLANFAMMRHRQLTGKNS